MPSADLRASCLEEITAAYKRFIRTRKDRATKGRQAAEARQEARWEITRTLRSELDAFEDALRELEVKVTDEYETLAEDLDAFDEEVLEQIQLRVDTEGCATTTVSMDKPADPQLEAQRRLKEAAEDKVRKLQQEEEKAQKEAEELKERLTAKESRAEAQPDEMMTGEGLDDTLELDPDAVPELGNRELKPEAIANLDMAYQLIQQVRWVPNVKMTFQILAVGFKEMETMLGEQWTRVYPEAPKWGDAIHPQILRLMNAALEKLSANYLAAGDSEERKEAQKKAKQTLLDQAKRLRTK